MINSIEYIRVKKSLIQFVHVHANSSVLLHVPGSQRLLACSPTHATLATVQTE